jgi:hypothetical protein
MTSIFSSRPIISRKRCTAGERSSWLTWALEERIEQLAQHVVRRRNELVFRRRMAAAGRAHHAKRHQLAHAVLDVQPQAAECLHQRLDIEGVIGARAEKTQDRGPERRLDEHLEPRLHVGGIEAPGGGRQNVVRHAVRPAASGSFRSSSSGTR